MGRQRRILEATVGEDAMEPPAQEASRAETVWSAWDAWHVGGRGWHEAVVEGTVADEHPTAWNHDAVPSWESSWRSTWEWPLWREKRPCGGSRWDAPSWSWCSEWRSSRWGWGDEPADRGATEEERPSQSHRPGEVPEASSGTGDVERSPWEDWADKADDDDGMSIGGDHPMGGDQEIVVEGICAWSLFGKCKLRNMRVSLLAWKQSG